MLDFDAVRVARRGDAGVAATLAPIAAARGRGRVALRRQVIAHGCGGGDQQRAAVLLLVGRHHGRLHDGLDGEVERRLLALPLRLAITRSRLLRRRGLRAAAELETLRLGLGVLFEVARVSPLHLWHSARLGRGIRYRSLHLLEALDLSCGLSARCCSCLAL